MDILWWPQWAYEKWQLKGFCSVWMSLGPITKIMTSYCHHGRRIDNIAAKSHTDPDSFNSTSDHASLHTKTKAHQGNSSSVISVIGFGFLLVLSAHFQKQWIYDLNFCGHLRPYHLRKGFVGCWERRLISKCSVIFPQLSMQGEGRNWFAKETPNFKSPNMYLTCH